MFIKNKIIYYTKYFQLLLKWKLNEAEVKECLDEYFFKYTYRGIREKGSGDVISSVCDTIYTIYLSLCKQKAETTSPDPFSWIPLYTESTSISQAKIVRVIIAVSSQNSTLLHNLNQPHNRRIDSWFSENGSVSLHSFKEHYLSIPEYV